MKITYCWVAATSVRTSSDSPKVLMNTWDEIEMDDDQAASYVSSNRKLFSASSDTENVKRLLEENKHQETERLEKVEAEKKDKTEKENAQKLERIETLKSEKARLSSLNYDVIQNKEREVEKAEKVLEACKKSLFNSKEKEHLDKEGIDKQIQDIVQSLV